MTCNVTGIAISPDGQVRPNATITFTRAPLDVVGQGVGFVVPDRYSVRTNSTGSVDFEIVPGLYIGALQPAGLSQVVEFRFSVPDEVAADFADCLSAAYVELKPSSVQQSEAARDAAVAAQAAAEDARDEAVAASDVAFIAANVYASTAAGLADTAIDDQFMVVVGDVIIRYRHDAGPVATQVAEYPTSDIIDDLAALDLRVDDVEADIFATALPPDTVGWVGDVLAATPDGGIAAPYNIIQQDAMPAPGTATEIRLQVQVDGVVQVRVYRAPDGLDVADNVSIVAQEVFSCVTGGNTFALSLPFQAGDYLGVQSPSNVLSRVSGGGPTVAFGGDSSTNEFAIDGTSTNGFLFQIDYTPRDTGILPDVEELTVRTETLELQVLDLQSDVLGVQNDIFAAAGTPGDIGYPGDIATDVHSGLLTGAFNIVFAQPMVSAGTITEVRAQCDKVQSLRVRVFRAPDGLGVGSTIQVVDQQIVSVDVGANTLVVDLDFAAGDYLGFQASGNTIRRLGTGPTVAYGGNSLLVPFTVTGNISTGYMVQIEFDTRDSGLQVDFAALETRVADLEVGGVSSGSATKTTLIGGLSAPMYIYAGNAGQSNMAGWDDGITFRTEYGAEGFTRNTSTLASLNLTALGEADERPAFGFAAYLRELLMFNGGPSQFVTDSKIVVGCNAQGGTAIGDMDKPSALYTHGQNQLTAAYADRGGATFYHMGQAFFQAEQDANLGVTRATYKSTQIAYATDYDTDSRVIAPGSYLRPTFPAQVTSTLGWVAGGIDQAWEIVMAQVEASRESELVALTGPLYHLPYGDDRHLTAEGSRVAGAYFARAMVHFAATASKLEPLWVVESYIDGADIVLKYNKPDLVIDTVTIPEQIQYGFSVTNALDANIPITVTVSGNTVRLTTGGTPSTGWTCYVGKNQATGLLPYYGGATNLRDTAGNGDTFDGEPLHNWATCEEIVF